MRFVNPRLTWGKAPHQGFIQVSKCQMWVGLAQWWHRSGCGASDVCVVATARNPEGGRVGAVSEGGGDDGDVRQVGAARELRMVRNEDVALGWGRGRMDVVSQYRPSPTGPPGLTLTPNPPTLIVVQWAKLLPG